MTLTNIMELLPDAWNCVMMLGAFFLVPFNPTYVLIRPTKIGNISYSTRRVPTTLMHEGYGIRSMPTTLNS